MANQKLYRVILRGMTHNSTGTAYGDCYVVARTSEEAYQQVREFLDKEDIGFDHERELHSVELLAEQARFPRCRTMLYMFDAPKARD